MLYDENPNVSRKCLLHLQHRCQDLECVMDEIDFRTNPNRPRPTSTPGAPEVSWGQTGRLHKVSPPPPIPSQRPESIPAPPLDRGRAAQLLPATSFLF